VRLGAPTRLRGPADIPVTDSVSTIRVASITGPRRVFPGRLVSLRLVRGGRVRRRRRRTRGRGGANGPSPSIVGGRGRPRRLIPPLLAGLAVLDLGALRLQADQHPDPPVHVPQRLPT